MFKITDRQGNENQNDNEISLLIHQDDGNARYDRSHELKMGRNWNSRAPLARIQNGVAILETVWQFLKTIIYGWNNFWKNAMVSYAF